MRVSWSLRCGGERGDQPAVAAASSAPDIQAVFTECVAPRVDAAVRLPCVLTRNTFSMVVWCRERCSTSTACTGVWRVEVDHDEAAAVDRVQFGDILERLRPLVGVQRATAP